MSKIRFTCFRCNSKLKMPAEYAGRKGRCPKCKAKNTIPSMEDTLEDTIILMFNDIDKYEDELDDVASDIASEFEQQDDDSYKDDDGENLPNR